MPTVLKNPKGVLYTSPDTLTIEGADGNQVKGVTVGEAKVMCELLEIAIARTSKRMGLSPEKLDESITGELLETTLSCARRTFVNPLFKEKG